MNDSQNVIQRVAKALGRNSVLTIPPTPPVIDEPITRLVHSDLSLSELFTKTADAAKMYAEMVYVDDLAGKLVSYLREHNVKRIALPESKLLKQINVEQVLIDASFEVKLWPTMTIDELYDFDAGVTDVYAAVAETGSLVVRASKEHGRALSLVPPVHVAIVEPKNLLPDLLDLFRKMAAEGVSSSTSIITGPSKTSDIEMNLVVGVHGPVHVKVFVLQ